jgi:hypothetical protein
LIFKNIFLRYKQGNIVNEETVKKNILDEIGHVFSMMPNAAHNAPERAGATQANVSATIFFARPFWSPFMRIVSPSPPFTGKIRDLFITYPLFSRYH